MSLLKLIIFSVTLTSINSLPINIRNVRDTANKLDEIDFHVNLAEDTVTPEEQNVVLKSEPVNVTEHATLSRTVSRTNQIRPGMVVNSYAVELEPNVNAGTFSGRLVTQVAITDQASREDPVMFYVRDLNINSVTYTLVGGTVFTPADFDVDDDDGTLEIDTGLEATLYTFIIEYTGSLEVVGQAFYAGRYADINYLAMNLHPTHARRVFPCMDEPTQASTISFTFNGLEYNHVMTNSIRDDTNIPNQFRALQGPPHLWSMAAHNLNNINVPTSGVFLYIRPGVSNQESQASVAINFYYNTLVEWTNKPYFEIVVNQAEQLSILALPDVSRDWYGLSTIAIWEPYILMENTCSVKQRFTALQKIAEAMARQWFGQVVFPENWRYEWVVAGLASYASYDILRDFQEDVTGLDISLLDVNTLFVTEVIQESLYRDGHASSLPLEIEEDIFEEDEIRDYMSGIHKVKAPALFWMMRLILGDETQDFIQLAGQSLITGRALLTVNTLNFIDAVNSHWTHSGNGRIDDVADYLEPWLENNGVPLIHVGLRQGGVLVTQERFGFSSLNHVPYNLPITYTVSTAPNYDNIYPIEMMEGTMTFNMFLDEDEGDYVLFNIQGQGYYRVTYDNDLWERIIEALDDPDRRAEIHPLNRATLIDDALNLARGGRIGYDTALEVVLTMQHETEYAPWKAFVRNMNFLRKRLVAYVWDDDDLDPDIYLRMVRRTIGTFEDEIGFTPDPLVTEPAMTSLTRGLVMDHACRAGYQPCIAAAVDWFYDPNTNDPVVNPNIPNDIRPAVYCTMVREGGDDVINAMYERLNIEVSMWERVVILESLTCSTDTNFVRTLLDETIAVNSEYTTEEKLKIFTAAVESNYDNAAVALNFLSQRTNEIRNLYGGPEKLEEAIMAMVENMGDGDLSNDFVVWVYAQNNNLDDSQVPAERAAAFVSENWEWDDRHRDFVYEWIDENDAPTLAVSLALIGLSFLLGLFNH